MQAPLISDAVITLPRIPSQICLAVWELAFSFAVNCCCCSTLSVTSTLLSAEHSLVVMEWIFFDDFDFIEV